MPLISSFPQYWTFCTSQVLSVSLCIFVPNIDWYRAHGKRFLYFQSLHIVVKQFTAHEKNIFNFNTFRKYLSLDSWNYLLKEEDKKMGEGRWNRGRGLGEVRGSKRRAEGDVQGQEGDWGRMESEVRWNSRKVEGKVGRRGRQECSKKREKVKNVPCERVRW